ncbi:MULTISPECIES: hypothetical protein [unclassified Streptomyces]|uniref:hypothetical protein n=1 Tax=unclassified Streptomyces TaxID=2593676 RepID=UPI002E79EBFC|nr:hypothetical protein [Streptomyces sp. JV176]MEE1803446.1 hypothetical protein [Streptomyces sp. JV176]
MTDGTPEEPEEPEELEEFEELEELVVASGKDKGDPSKGGPGTPARAWKEKESQPETTGVRMMIF